MLFFVNILVESDMSKKTLGKRSRTAPKRELEELIELVNLLPPKMELKSLNALLGEREGYEGPRPGTQEARKRRERLWNAFVDYMMTLPSGFVEEMYKETRHIDLLGEQYRLHFNLFTAMAIEEYERFIQIRRTLRELISPQLSSFSLFGLKPVKTPAVEEIWRENGRFRRLGNPVAAAVDGEEVARLRECQRCQRIFWAYNIGSRACSKPCANVLRQRDYYNQHRRKGR
jgi:hypothetical protein